MGLEAVGLHDVLGTEAKQQAGLSCQPCVLTRLSQQTGVRVWPGECRFLSTERNHLRPDYLRGTLLSLNRESHARAKYSHHKQKSESLSQNAPFYVARVC